MANNVFTGLIIPNFYKVQIFTKLLSSLKFHCFYLISWCIFLSLGYVIENKEK